jgi:hypothetical protein
MLCGCLASAHAAVPAVTFHVATGGDDAWSGRLSEPNGDRTDGPLASLVGARDAIRRLKAEGPLPGPARVVVADGTYRLAAPVVFTPMDSGTPDCPVTYEAAPGARPVFTGGRRIRGFRAGEDGIWRVHLPEVADGTWRFEQLYVSGRRAVRARMPNRFWFYADGTFQQGSDPATGEVADLSRRAFRFRPGDVEPWGGLTDAVLVVYHSWEVARLPIAAIDAEAHVVFTAGEAKWPFGRWGRNQRYYVENVREALDAPGEWFLGRDGTLHYVPLPGERTEEVEVVAPVACELLRIKGEAAAGRTVEHVAFKGLSFRHCAYMLPPEGHGDWQAASTVPAAVTADGARGVAFRDCEFAHLGGHGVWIRRGSTDCHIEHCRLHDLGAGAVRIGETVIRPEGPERTGRIVVDDNIIHGGGRDFLGACAVWIGQSGHNEVTHNDIADFAYTGISVGWTWGYGESLAVGNRIEFNHIHHLGRGVGLNDMGGLYTLGVSPGTTVSFNHIHHVHGYPHHSVGAWGLYNDEGSTGIVMEENLVHDVSTGTYHLHYGRENVLRNNVLAFSERGQLQRTRRHEHVSFTMERNVVYWRGGPLLTGQWGDDNFRLASNLYWNEAGPVEFDGLSLTEWQARGHGEGSIVAEPGFAAPAARDFRLGPDSPARRVGFRPFDYGRAGVRRDDPEWVALADSEDYGPPQPVPDLPPFGLQEDFESLPVGAPPPHAYVQVEGRGDSIAVTDEAAAGGRQSLKLADAPGLEHAYNPHFAYAPDHTGGVTRFAFAMRVEPGVRMFHEWRDWRQDPYAVGPSLHVAGLRLVVGGRELLRLPEAEWVRFEVSAALGEGAAGTWEMAVALPGEEAHRFEGLPCGSPEFRAVTWLGFSSVAHEATAFYLDDLELRNEPGKP